MQRILLVIDSFAELTTFEQTLKKLGFDTLGMQNALSFQDQLLGFSPDLVVMSGKGTRVRGFELSQKIKKRKGLPKIALLLPKSYKATESEMAQAQMDIVFESPMDPLKFIGGICQLLGLDANLYFEKYTRLQGFASGGEYGTSTKQSASPPAARSAAYVRLAEQITLPPGPGGFARERVQSALREWRKLSSPELDEDLDSSRREFVRALFSKK